MYVAFDFYKGIFFLFLSDKMFFKHNAKINNRSL